MLDRSERKVILGYLSSILGHGRLSHETSVINSWLEENAEVLGLRIRDEKGTFRKRRRQNSPSPDRMEAMRSAVDAELTKLVKAGRSRVDAVAETVGAVAGCSQDDIRILGILLRYHLYEPIEELIEGIGSFGSRRAMMWAGSAAAMLGISKHKALRALAPEGPLVTAGLAYFGEDGDLYPLDRLVDLAERDRLPKDIRVDMIGQPLRPTLQWDDFAHVEDAEHVARLLRAASEQRGAGINVLIYGPPGTGKTEFCKTVAKRAGLTLFSIQGEEADQDPDAPANMRLGRLRLAQRMLNGGGAGLLFDEADDVLSAGGGLFGRPGDGRKALLHKVLEEAQSPVLWTTNEPEAMSPAVLRRMTFAVEMRVPTAAVRTRLWTREAKRQGVVLPKAEIETLARTFEAAPAIAASAIRAAAMMGGGVRDIRRGVLAIDRVMRGPSARLATQAAAFDPTLMNADTDIVRLAERIARPDAPLNWSVLLIGPSGTGKSACVRHLAERLGMEVLHKRASDMMGSLVGDTEKAIANAFAEARAARSVLIIDEADSMIADRRGAHQSWEVSQVNEMLTQMESHPLPFACSTNLVERLDPASMRRFTFKIRVGYLKPAQATHAFRLFFDQEPPPALANLDRLAPGDFAVVRKQAQVLGFENDPAELVRMLAAEQAAKSDTVGRPIGFMTAA